MDFITQLEKNTNKSVYTENGAISNKSTLDPVLDYFSRAGAMRSRPNDAVQLFQKAYSAFPELAIKCLFYLRDIRGGQGERSIFRATLNSLDNETLNKVAKFVPVYGRFDDLPLTEDTIDLLYTWFLQDEQAMKENKSVSLLAKWLPSENASSKDTTANAYKVINQWGISPKEYRKRVTTLRKYIRILEQKMSAKEWGDIDYSKLPSQAHRKHVKAFTRNDAERYSQYINDVSEGKSKINSSTMFTYEFYDELFNGQQDPVRDKALEEMWKALPDYTNGNNALVLADVSGSMCGRPMSISTTLAVYFAERNKGIFANKYMTFTNIPEVVTIQNTSLRNKLRYVQLHNVGYNTNLAAAFNAILKAAVDSQATPEELPTVLYIISDMEFDSQMGDCGETNFETAQRLFQEAGYELPHVVFWNVNCRNDQSPATKFDDRVTLISGSNQSSFRYAVEGKNPLELMLEVLCGERYEQVKI